MDEAPVDEKLSRKAKKLLEEANAAAELKRANDEKKQSTESTVKDYVFNWIVDRYTRNKHRFEFSDTFIWKGAVYVIPEIAGYVIFIALFLWLGLVSLKKYGEARTYIFFMLLILWRLNILIKLQSKFVKKFQ